MNTYGTSAICPCCGKTLYTSNIPKYSFVCKDCNKNFYTKEVKDTFAEYWDEVTESTKQLWDVYKRQGEKYGLSIRITRY